MWPTPFILTILRTKRITNGQHLVDLGRSTTTAYRWLDGPQLSTRRNR
ncbi:hypothetical protein LINPERHAP2_LOCUS4706 [Linum perenne]